MKSITTKIKNYVIKGHNFLIDIFFPIECLHCKKEGSWLCHNCENLIITKDSLRCPQCNINNNTGEYCSNCKKKYYLNGIWIAFQYNDKLIQNLIKKMKYFFIKDISFILAKQLSKYIKNSTKIQNIIKSKNILIIPVPLHKKKLKWRGFNQAEEIAKHLTNNLNLSINTKNLIKTKNNKSQTNLTKEKRINNVKNVYNWTGPNLKNKHIILIDDVVTSGATLNECAKILKKNQAKKVWGLVIAKN